MLKESTRIVDPGPRFRMRRLCRLLRHEVDVIVTWRHRWRHKSTRHRHFPIWSLCWTWTPKSLSFRDV